MLIILEGCDGSGKSTLAINLSRIIGAEIIHCTKDTPNNYEFFKGIIEASKTRNIIADRFMYGQFVYQLPEERRLSVPELRMLEVDLLKAGGSVVFVTAAQWEIEDRLQERNETTWIPVPKILQGFEDVFDKSILPVPRWFTGQC